MADPPDEFGKWSAVYRQFIRWSRAGLRDILLEAFAETDAISDALHMIDSTIVRLYHHAAGGKGRFGRTLLAVRPILLLDQNSIRANAEGLSIGTMITAGEA